MLKTNLIRQSFNRTLAQPYRGVEVFSENRYKGKTVLCVLIFKSVTLVCCCASDSSKCDFVPQLVVILYEMK